MQPRFRSSILVVDDEELVCSLLSKALGKHGHSVSAAGTKADALDLIEHEDFDLIVVDKNLPDGTGLDIIEAAVRAGKDFESIVITGFSDLGSAIRAVNVGVFRYIPKPFNLQALLVDVDKALETRDLRRDLAQRSRELELANDHLRESEQRMRELADFLPELVFEMNADKQFSFINRKGFELTGYTRDDLARGLSAGDLISDEDKQRAVGDLDLLLAGKTPRRPVYSARRKNGTTFRVVGRAVPIVHDGIAVGIRGLLIEVTAKR